MIEGILAKKLGMTRIFKDGKSIPITLLEATPNTVLQVKNTEKDGYCAIQLGYEDKKEKHATKAEVGHAKKNAQTGPKKFVKEIVWDGKDEMKAGQTVDLSLLEKVIFVDIVGLSKGKSFQGAVKRHHFKGGPKTHGQSDRLRATGSIGASSWPSRVFKGQRMPGHMGDRRATTRSARVIEINVAEGLIAVKGGVVGANGSYVMIKKGLRSKKSQRA